MGLTNMIEIFLKELLDENDGQLEIRRNELANQFDCAPSQINYVLSTRFSPHKGYYIESRRGGSGFIRIVKLSFEEDQSLEELIYDNIEDSITKDQALHLIQPLLEEKKITEREYLLISHAISNQALEKVRIEDRNTLRADILKTMLLAFVR